MKSRYTPAEIEDLAESIALRVVEKMNQTSQFMDIHAAAAYIGCSVATIERKIRSGELPSVKIGRLRRLRKSDIEQIPLAVPASTPQES